MSIVELGTQFVAMFFEVTLRSSIVIVSCAILMVLFRSSRAELKHLICRGALYGLLLLPVIQVTAPPFRRASRVLSRAGMGMIPLMATGSKSGMAAPKIMPPVNFSDNKSSENKRSFRWIPLLAGAHLTVTLALLARLGISFLRLSAIIRQGVPIPDRHLRELGHEIWLESLAPFKPSILVSPDVSVPLAVGLSEGFILLPTSWSRWQRDKLRAALVHEMEHVRRHDPATAFLASLVQCFFWMHPLLYWLRRQLTALSEEACDEVVIQCMDPERYCRILIEFASDMTASQGRLVAVSSAVAQRSSIRRRLDRIFSMSSRTRVNGRFAKSLLVGAFLPVLYLTAATRFDQGEIAKTPNAGYLILIQNTERAEEVESDLARDPDNLNMRGALLAFYSNMRENAKFTEHMLWTIEHHPEASSAAMQSYDFSVAARIAG
jgi:beta-lactamase regulating signal transducer with metallopeptidase domain